MDIRPTNICAMSVFKVETENYIYHFPSSEQILAAFQGLGGIDTQLMRMSSIVTEKSAGRYVKHRAVSHEVANLIKGLSQEDIDHIRSN
jgi:hypothetical protein